MLDSPIEIPAMWWVDLAQGVCFRLWFGEPSPDGLRRHFQVAECWVDRALVIVFWSFPARPPEQQTAAIGLLRAQFGPDALISLEDEYGSGWSRMSPLTPQADAEARERVAIAVAVTHASWGWDESEQIRVEDAAGLVVARPRRTERGWSAAAEVLPDPPLTA